jgi:hypothetical protein
VRASNILAVVALLCIGIGGMFSRSGLTATDRGQSASEGLSRQSVAVEEAGQSPGTRVAASPTVTDSWDASSVFVVGELAMEAAVAGDGVVASPAAVAPAPSGWPLSRDEMLSVLVTAGWPEEWLGEALSVACGFDNPRYPSGESGCHPGLRGDGGRSLGLFQIQPRYWSERCGAGEAELLLPLPNAACALIIVRDNEKAGRPRWTYWSIRP